MVSPTVYDQRSWFSLFGSLCWTSTFERRIGNSGIPKKRRGFLNGWNRVGPKVSNRQTA
jgi:hypothetical protein